MAKSMTVAIVAALFFSAGLFAGYSVQFSENVDRPENKSTTGNDDRSQPVRDVSNVATEADDVNPLTFISNSLPSTVPELRSAELKDVNSSDHPNPHRAAIHNLILRHFPDTAPEVAEVWTDTYAEMDLEDIEFVLEQKRQISTALAPEVNSPVLLESPTGDLLNSRAEAAVSHVAADDKAVVETSKVDDPNVKLTAGTWKDVEELVARNMGKIVVVDIWSTSCLPCMTEFPRLVEMHNTHHEHVVCISFNVDYVGIKAKPATVYEKKVHEFLQKHKATCTNILSTTPSDAVFQSLELSSIPAAYVYGRDGKLLKRFDDSLLVDGKEEAFTYKDDINPFVEKLLQDK